MPPPGEQIFWLLILAIPIACISRTVVYEEIFREPREWCRSQERDVRRLLKRKFFYVFTCEYCFSHWVTLFFVVITGFKLLLPDWRGYLIGFFALVFVANAYLNLYARLRVDIASEKMDIEQKEKEIEHKGRYSWTYREGGSSPGSTRSRRRRIRHRSVVAMAGDCDRYPLHLECADRGSERLHG